MIRIEEGVVDQRAGNLHAPRDKGPARHHLLRLGDDDAARVVGCHRHGKHLSVDRFLVEGEIPILVDSGSPYDGDINRKRAEEEPLLSCELDDFDKIFSSRTLFAPGLARVDVGV